MLRPQMLPAPSAPAQRKLTPDQCREPRRSVGWAPRTRGPRWLRCTASLRLSRSGNLTIPWMWKPLVGGSACQWEAGFAAVPMGPSRCCESLTTRVGAPAVAVGVRNTLQPAPRRRQRRSAGGTGKPDAWRIPDALPRGEVLGGLADLPSRHASRTGNAAPRYHLGGRDEVRRLWPHDDMTKAATYSRRVIVDSPALSTDEARADKGPAAQPFVRKIDRADIPVTTRAVGMDLEAECGDFIKCPEGKGAQHALELGRDSPRLSACTDGIRCGIRARSSACAHTKAIPTTTAISRAVLP